MILVGLLIYLAFGFFEKCKSYCYSKFLSFIKNVLLDLQKTYCIEEDVLRPHDLTATLCHL
jgi:hypothetical protein